MSAEHPNRDLDVDQYLITESMPTFWCPGCGNGIILGAVARAWAAMGLPPQRIAVVTGIGCFGKADDYTRVNTVHGTHGRALPIGSGIKAVNPDMNVFCLMGDGDCATIGGNHLIHAARRNIDIVAVVSNNFNYGMTGGQFSATTPGGGRTSTSFFGNPEAAFDLCSVAAAAGAGFVARCTVYHVRLLEKLIIEATRRRGFSLVEVVSSCPVYFGRYNRRNSPAEMMHWWRDRARRVSPDDPDAQRWMEPTDVEQPIPIGVLAERPTKDFGERYAEVQRLARAEDAGAPDQGLPVRERRAHGRERHEVVFAGAGGQGLVLAGALLGEAAVRDGLYACSTQSYGTASRGGMSRAEVVVSTEEIRYPMVVEPTALVTLTQEAYDDQVPRCGPDALVLYDVEAVAPRSAQAHQSGVAFTATARDLGSASNANMVALGAVGAAAGAVTIDSLRESVKERFGERAGERIRALEAGRDLMQRKR